MKKTTIVITAVILVILVGAAIIFLPKLTSGSNLNIANAEDLSKLVEDIYAGVTLEMPGVMTQAIDVTDKDMVSYVTGLENGDELEYAVVSEPMMSSQAYSMVIAKVKSGASKGEKVATITEAQLREVAETKLPDLNAYDVEHAMKIVEGTARNMGIKVEK